jgi:hypothetical protein
MQRHFSSQDDSGLMAPHHRAYDWENEAEDRAASGNLLPPILGLIGIGVLACATWALGPTGGGRLGDELSHCAATADDLARLACYDHLAFPERPAKGAFAPSLTRHVPEGSQ